MIGSGRRNGKSCDPVEQCRAIDAFDRHDEGADPECSSACVGARVLANHETPLSWCADRAERSVEHASIGFGGTYLVGDREPGDAVEDADRREPRTEIDMKVTHNGDLDAVSMERRDDLHDLRAGAVRGEVPVGLLKRCSQLVVEPVSLQVSSLDAS